MAELAHPTTRTASPLRLVREARDYLLAAARERSWLKRSEAISRAEQQLAKAERTLRLVSTG